MKVNKIDEYEIMSFTKMSSIGGFGTKTKNALDAYCTGLKAVCNDGFGPGDESTAHDVLDALQRTMEKFAKDLEDVELMIDCLFEVIEQEILAKEDRIAQTVLGD